jgi:hypothetical protein
MLRGRYEFMDCAGETPARKEVCMINCEIQSPGFDHGQEAFFDPFNILVAIAYEYVPLRIIIFFVVAQH